MTDIKTALEQGQKKISPHSPSARIDAEILLAHVLEVSRTYLYTHAKDALTPEILENFEALLQKRLNGFPIAYLTGVREFWSMPFYVNESTLIPRPETELLIETTLSLLDMPQASILDLGTGSGAIALALAKEKPHWQITACDINPEALTIAKKNAQNLNLNHVNFIYSEWFSAFSNQRFDAILSNPPYIEEDDPHLTQGDLRFEPKLALASGSDGLRDLRHIIQNAPSYLKPNGLLLLEHGYQQASPVAKLFEKTQNYYNINCWHDYQNHPRISGGKAKKL